MTKKPKQARVLGRLLSYMKPDWKQLILILFLVIGITILDLYRPILIGNTIDQSIIPIHWSSKHFVSQKMHALQQIKFATILYLIFLILIYLGNILQIWTLQKIGQKVIYRIRQQLFSHVQRLPLSFFDHTPVGNIVTRITNDTEALNDLYSNIFTKLFQNITKLIALFFMMLSLNVTLTIYTLSFLPLIMILTYFFKKILRNAYRITRTKITELNAYLSEHLSCMLLIQLFAKEKLKYNEFKKKSSALYQAHHREMMVFALFRPAIYFTSVLALIVIILSGSYHVQNHALSIGTLFIFVQYVSCFFEPIQELAEQFTTLQSALASGEKIFSLLDEMREQALPKNIIIPKKRFSGKITFDHVWFAYQPGHWVLKDLSFTILPGQKVAFVGETGAGKSSILQVLSRYYEIQKGHIYVDDIDIQQIPTNILRRMIGYVQQESFIFTGTIHSNICLLDQDIQEQTIQEAAACTNIASFIEHLPRAYQEPVSEKGLSLSSGQRQLLSFTRTLAFSPAIFVLDEATSHIDLHTEFSIQHAIKECLHNHTAIFIAHRLSNMPSFDSIFVVHHGQIQEKGTHASLLQKKGIYHKLYTLQQSHIQTTL